METERLVGTVSTEIEECPEGFRVIMTIYDPSGVPHSRRDMIAASREEANMAASYLRGIAIDHGCAIGAVH